ncbi:hypothetical protein V7S43_002118 [Phytophthora oleae]|uniref:SP-RING-type domain-containing protein n=1 Tax=Phytophthora oleae TaxID=2107226 RepID=A0ABD3G4C1_9STRA
MLPQNHFAAMATGGPCSLLRPECEQSPELTEEPTAALTELDTTLNDRFKELEQKIQELQERNDQLAEHSRTLEKEKNRHVKRVGELEEKRDRLWDDIADLKGALKAEKEHLQEVTASRKEHRQAESLLREELGTLRQDIQSQKQRLEQATTEANEKVREAIWREKVVKETVKLLEKRLQDQNKLIRDQQASFSQVTAQSNKRAKNADQKHMLLKESVDQLEKRLVEERRNFEEERVRLQQQAITSQKNDMQSDLTGSLEQAIPHLRSLLSAFDRAQSDEKCRPVSTGKSHGGAREKLGEASDSDLFQRLKEQASTFDQERAQLLEQASDAAETQLSITRRNLLEREEVLTCPITLELVEFPVVTGCCGKTFSSEGLRQAITQNSRCPFCRGQLSSTHPNRDVAKLVELHQRERSLLGMSDLEQSSAIVSALQPSEATGSSTASTGHSPSSRRSTNSLSTRQSRHREHRSERIQARSQVQHRRSPMVNTPATAATSSETNSSSSTAVATSASEAQQRSTPSDITSGGLYVSRIGSGEGPTLVPPHMVRSVLASMRFPKVEPRRTGSRRHRSKARTASSAPSPASSTPASSRRTAISSLHSFLRPVSSAVSNATATSQSKRRANSSTSTVLNTPASGVRSSGVQASRSSGISNAAADRKPSIAKMEFSSVSAATTTAAQRPGRISASQDDSALQRQRQNAARISLSQPAPRQPLRNLAQSVTTLEDLLGSDFNSDSDSV